MIKFAGLHASLSPPWTPLAGEDAGADVEAEAVVDAEVATDAETASAQPSSGDANADFEAQPTDCEGPAPAPPVPINGALRHPSHSYRLLTCMCTYRPNICVHSDCDLAR